MTVDYVVEGELAFIDEETLQSAREHFLSESKQCEVLAVDLSVESQVLRLRFEGSAPSSFWDTTVEALRALAEMADSGHVDAYQEDSERIRIHAGGEEESLEDEEDDDSDFAQRPILDPDEPGISSTEAGFRIRRLGLTRDQGLIPRLLAYLKHPDEDVRGQAVDALVMVRTPRLVDILAEQVKTETSFTVRMDIARALKSVGGAAAIGTLCAMARQPVNHHDHCAVVAALGALRAVPAIPLLVEALQPSDSPLPHAAAEALGRIRHPHAVQALVNAITTIDTIALCAVADGVCALKASAALEPLKARKKAGKLGSAAPHVTKAIKVLEAAQGR